MKILFPFPLILLIISGCGYNSGFRLQELGVKSIGLEIASNLTYRQRLEFFLSRQIQREIEARIRTVLAPPEKADAVLYVNILKASEPVLGEGVDDKVSVSSLAIMVTAKLVKRTTGKIIKEGKLADREEFFVNVGETVDKAAMGVSKKIGRRLILFLDPEIKKLENWQPPQPSNEKSDKKAIK